MKKTFLFLVAITLCYASLNAQVARRGSIGAGIGIPYGVLGINGEVALQDHLSLSAGVGTTLMAGVGYAFGARAYVTSPEKMFRPRVSIHYGVNGMVAVSDGGSGLSSNGKKFNGITVGIGTQVMFGKRRRSGFDFEILYLATTGGLQDEIDRMNNSGNYLHIETPLRVKFLMGYRFGF